MCVYEGGGVGVVEEEGGREGEGGVVGSVVSDVIYV